MVILLSIWPFTKECNIWKSSSDLFEERDGEIIKIIMSIPLATSLFVLRIKLLSPQKSILFDVLVVHHTTSSESDFTSL